MCELLINWADKTSSDFYLNCYLPKVGDVIYIAEDNHRWGIEERGIATWRILRTPNILASDLAFLTSWEINTNPHPDTPSRTLQYRGFFIDPAKISGDALAAYMADDQREQYRYLHDVALVSFTAMTSQRVAIADPTIIGQPPAVIG